MNIAGLLSSPSRTHIATNRQQRQAEFQQLGKDLQSGDLSAAKTDFATLTSLLSASKASTTSAGDASIPKILSQDFQKLGGDLKSGDLSAAQQDYSQLQQDAQKTHTAHGNRHHPGSDADSSESNSNRGFLNLLTNVATTAASAYGSAGFTGLSAAGSLISALV